MASAHCTQLSLRLICASYLPLLHRLLARTKACSNHSTAWGHPRGKLGSLLSSTMMITVSSKAFLAMWEPLGVGSMLVRAARETAPEQ